MRKALTIYAVLLALLVLVLVLAPAEAFAQKACVVLSSSAQPFKEAMSGFKEGFSGTAYEIVMPSEPGKAAEMVADLNAKGCNVVVPMGSAALKFLKLRMNHRPMVFAMTLSPAIRGFEGLNVTGVYLEPSPQAQLTAVRKVLPTARRVGVLYSVQSDYLASLKREAAGLGMEIVQVSTPSTGDAIREGTVLADKCDVIMMIPDTVTSAQEVFKVVLEASLKTNVPIFALAAKHVHAGALAALASDYRGNGAQAAEMSKSVAGGARASAIRPEYSQKVGLVINLKAAGRMGIKVPASVVSKAVEVYR